MFMAGEQFKTDLTNVPLDQVDLTTRARNCLVSQKISTVGQLADLSSLQIMRWRNAGRKTLRELQDVLGRLSPLFRKLPSTFLAIRSSESSSSMGEGRCADAA